jgi:hypothetical protein
VSILIKLGKLSTWPLFAAEFLGLVTLLVAPLYLASADWIPLLSDMDQKHVVHYRYVAIGAIATTNILLSFVIASLLIELKYGSGFIPW